MTRRSRSEESAASSAPSAGRSTVPAAATSAGSSRVAGSASRVRGSSSTSACVCTGCEACGGTSQASAPTSTARRAPAGLERREWCVYQQVGVCLTRAPRRRAKVRAAHPLRGHSQRSAAATRQAAPSCSSHREGAPPTHHARRTAAATSARFRRRRRRSVGSPPRPRPRQRPGHAAARTAPPHPSRACRRQHAPGCAGGCRGQEAGRWPQQCRQGAGTHAVRRSRDLGGAGSSSRGRSRRVARCRASCS
eukprot:scaffold83048_cov69-Phaeocystis_antarctica.AAC.1